MEIKNLIEITPEIKKEAYDLLKASKRLHELLKEQGAGQFGMSVYTSNSNNLTIYDRREYSDDGEGTDLGFYVHKFYPDGSYIFDFIAEDNEKAKAYDEEFNMAFFSEESEDSND
jgi:hypothetical protein